MLPNCIIAGAPKCGTTSLYYWLKAHPEVGASNRKEVQYFMDKQSSVFHPEANYLEHGISGYEQFFPDIKGDTNVIIESTPGYIYQKTALDVLGKELPEAKFIFLLREPVNRIKSVYKYFSQNRAELPDSPTFSIFIEQVKSRDERLKWNEFLYDAIQHGEYINYLLEWEKRYGKDRIKVLLYEDIVNNPQKLMYDLCQYLNIDSDFYDSFSFEAKNKTVEIDNFVLHSVAKVFSNLVPFGDVREKLKGIYLRFNSSAPAPKAVISSEESKILQELTLHYQSYNAQLKKHYQLDIGSWNKDKSKG